MMPRSRFIDREEVEFRLGPKRAREHQPTPWWMLARMRIGRVQRASSRRGSIGTSSRTPLRTRRCMVKASYSRNNKSGRWSAHARYLTREGAQHQQVRGVGFDSASSDLDVVAKIRDWEKSGDEL